MEQLAPPPDPFSSAHFLIPPHLLPGPCFMAFCWEVGGGGAMRVDRSSPFPQKKIAMMTA